MCVPCVACGRDSFLRETRKEPQIPPCTRGPRPPPWAARRVLGHDARSPPWLKPHGQRMRVKYFEQGSCVKFHISRSRSQIHVKGFGAPYFTGAGLAEVPAESNTLPPRRRSSPAHLLAVPLGVSLGRVLRGEATLRAHLAATRAACVGRCCRVARLSLPLLPRVKNELQPDADCDDHELVEHVEHRQRDCDLRLSARRTGQA